MLTHLYSVYHVLFIHALVDGHLACYYILVIMSNIFINLFSLYKALTKQRLSIPLDIYLRVELLGHIYKLYLYIQLSQYCLLKDYSFSMELSWPPCQNIIDHNNKHIFLNMNSTPLIYMCSCMPATPVIATLT